MSDINQEIQALKTKEQAAVKAKLMAEHRAEVARADVANAQEILSAQYGITSKEEALELLAEMESQLAAKAAQIQDLLAMFEGKP